MRLFHVFEIVALLVSMMTINKTRGTFLVLFIPFLALVCLYEYGSVSGWFFRDGSNHEAANFFMLLPVSFYLAMFFHVFQQARTGRIVVLTWLLWILLYLINIVLIQKSGKYNSYSYLAGSLIMISWCCYLFYRIMSATVELNLLRYPFFWLGTGLLFFYLLKFGYTAYFEFMAYNANSMYIQLYDLLTSIAIIVLYSCISIGLLCFKPPVRKI